MLMRNMLLYLLLTLLVLLPLKSVAAEATNVPPTTVLVDYDQGKVKYEVNSKPIRSENILEVLGRVEKQRGQEASVGVLIDLRNSLAALSNIRGIIGKVGFLRVHYFCFTADRKMMEEIILGQQPAVPFSQNPSSQRN